MGHTGDTAVVCIYIPGCGVRRRRFFENSPKRKWALNENFDPTAMRAVSVTGNVISGDLLFRALLFLCVGTAVGITCKADNYGKNLNLAGKGIRHLNYSIIKSCLQQIKSGGQFVCRIETINFEHTDDSSAVLVESIEADAFTSFSEYYAKCSQDYHHPALTTVNLQHNSIKSIGPGAFNITGGTLRTINLAHNRLTSLATGTLYGCTNLTNFNLTGNPLQSITAGAFDDATSLKGLDLRGFPHVRLTADAFLGLSGLTSLSLPPNQANLIASTGVFAGLSSLPTLDLSGVPIAHLQNQTFFGLSSCISLKLAVGSLRVIDPGAFLGLSALPSLSLAYLSMTSLQRGVFQGLDSLTTLDITNSKLEMLVSDNFQGASALVSLDLSGSASNPGVISHLSRGALRGLHNLEHIDLQHNLFRNVPCGLFHNLTVKLQGNPVNSISISTEVIDQTSVASCDLILGGSDAGGVNKSDFVTMNVSYAINNYTGPQVQGLAPGAIGLLRDMGFSNIQTWDLSSNLIESLNPLAFQQCAGLQRLVLSSNKISQLDEATFQNCTALRSLDLWSNSIHHLSDIQGSFQHLSALTTLELGANSLHKVPSGGFQGLRSLQVLKVSCNQISNWAPGTRREPGGVLQGMTKLTTLDLSQNQLRKISADMFLGAESTTHIDLSHNLILALNEHAFSALPRLTGLNLVGNSLTYIGKGALEGPRWSNASVCNNGGTSAFETGTGVHGDGLCIPYMPLASNCSLNTSSTPGKVSCTCAADRFAEDFPETLLPGGEAGSCLCPRGQYWTGISSNSPGCAQCPRGTYSDVINANDRCTPCQSNYTEA